MIPVLRPICAFSRLLLLAVVLGVSSANVFAQTEAPPSSAAAGLAEEASPPPAATVSPSAPVAETKPAAPPVAKAEAEPAPAPLLKTVPAATPVAASVKPDAEPFSGPPEDENAAQYCSNIADPAADARFARQSAALQVLQTDIEQRIARMETKRAELEAVLKRREELLQKADESVVAIYSKMRPDAAASQMSIMDAQSAAAILEKLNPRMASAILGEMEPAKAAQLTMVMAGSAKDLKGEEAS